MNRSVSNSLRAASLPMLASALLMAAPAQAGELFFQMNPNLGGSGEARQAFIFGEANSTGTVTNNSGFSQAFDLGADGFAVVDVPLSAQLANGVVQDLGFKIASMADLSAYFLSRRDSTTDMSYIIDGDNLGTEYFVAGYQNLYEDQMSVQATVDNTVVTFSPKGGASFDVTLDAGQTYMHTSNSQLTGSKIVADKPIAVFAGNRCTNVPSGFSACDHLVEQMPSVDQLSTQYYLSQSERTGTLGDVFRVVATTNGTEVEVDGVLVATLAEGEYYEGRVSGGIVIDASQKVLVTQYLIGQSQAGANTDPAMTIVPGSDQWLDSYVFATPSGTADFPTDFISVIVSTMDLPSLMVDGVLANAGLFSALGSTGYSFGNIDVSGTSGPFTITADSPLQLLLSGFDSYDSYFTYGGAAFAPGASPPPPPPTPGIPEPSTWALMLLGMFGIGGTMRSRSVKASISYA